jgi:hypothetical protein
LIRIIRYFLLIGLFEGIAVLVFTFATPSDVDKAWLLGYSRMRWAQALWSGQGVLAFFLLTVLSWRRPIWLTSLGHHLDSWLRSARGFPLAILFMLSGGASGAYFFFLTYAITDTQVQGYFQRLLLLVVWITALCMQALLTIVLFYWKEHWPALRGWSTRVGHALAQNKEEILAIGLLLLLSVTLFWPVKYPNVKTGTLYGWDYVVHTRFAERMAETRRTETSFFLYELLVIAAHLLKPTSDYLWIGKLVALIFDLVTAVVAFAIVRRSVSEIFPGHKWLQALTSLAVALSITLVAPVSVLTWGSHNLLYGYIGINTTHNPTYLLLKPLALLLFLNSLEIFTYQPGSGSRIRFFLTGLLTILATLAKPNYIICLLPALSLLAFYWLIKKRSLDWQRLIFGVILPAVIILSWQYLATYTTDRVLRAEGGIVFAPFAVYARDSGMLLPKFFLSILFPLTVYALYYKDASKDIGLNLAWLIFFFGAFYTYMLAETGLRFQDGNFKWSGQVTLFILFLVSVVFFLRINSGWLFGRVSRKPGYVFSVVAIMFGLHLASGMLFYYLQLTQPANPWW